MKLGDKVKIKDVKKTKNDSLLEDKALEIIEASNFKGEITKTIDNIYMVGFKNDKGWVTQGFKKNEIEVL